MPTRKKDGKPPTEARPRQTDILSFMRALALLQAGSSLWRMLNGRLQLGLGRQGKERKGNGIFCQKIKKEKEKEKKKKKKKSIHEKKKILNNKKNKKKISKNNELKFKRFNTVMVAVSAVRFVAFRFGREGGGEGDIREGG